MGLEAGDFEKIHGTFRRIIETRRHVNLSLTGGKNGSLRRLIREVGTVTYRVAKAARRNERRAFVSPAVFPAPHGASGDPDRLIGVSRELYAVLKAARLDVRIERCHDNSYGIFLRW
jgi:hypothetical protein